MTARGHTALNERSLAVPVSQVSARFDHGGMPADPIDLYLTCAHRSLNPRERGVLAHVGHTNQGIEPHTHRPFAPAFIYGQPGVTRETFLTHLNPAIVDVDEFDINGDGTVVVLLESHSGCKGAKQVLAQRDQAWTRGAEYGVHREFLDRAGPALASYIATQTGLRAFVITALSNVSTNGDAFVHCVNLFDSDAKPN